MSQREQVYAPYILHLIVHYSSLCMPEFHELPHSSITVADIGAVLGTGGIVGIVREGLGALCISMHAYARSQLVYRSE